MNFAGKSYTSFQNVNVKGKDSDNPGSFKVEGGGFHSTLSVNTTYLDANKAITLPSKSGTLPISGTFAVDFTAVAATTFLYTTAVTVSGIRVEDGLTVTPNFSTIYSSARILIGAVPTADTITLTFANIGAVGLGEYAKTFGYTAVR